MDAAIQRWKCQHTTETVTDPKPNMEQFDQIREQWMSRDKVAKLVGMFSSVRLAEDWEAAEPDAAARKIADWEGFKQKMNTYYKPTENITLRHYQFRGLSQAEEESFPHFCNRVEKEAKTCSFKCENVNCTAEATAVRDQIVIGTINTRVREEALLQSWKLKSLREEGRKIESAVHGTQKYPIQHL